MAFRKIKRGKKSLIERIFIEFNKNECTENLCILELPIRDYADFIEFHSRFGNIVSTVLEHPLPVLGMKVELKKTGKLKVRKQIKKSKQTA